MVRAKEPRKICPGELGSLYCIAVGHPIPTVLHRIIEAVEFVVLVPDQTAARSALNRRFSQLRRAHPQILLIPVMLDWLNDVHTQELFSSNGEHWARIKLIESVERMAKSHMQLSVWIKTGVLHRYLGSQRQRMQQSMPNTYIYAKVEKLLMPS